MKIKMADLMKRRKISNNDKCLLSPLKICTSYNPDWDKRPEFIFEFPKEGKNTKEKGINDFLNSNKIFRIHLKEALTCLKINSKSY